MVKSVPCTIACFHSLIAEFNRPREFTNASSNDINCNGRVPYEKQWSSGRSGVWYLEFQIVSLGSSGIIHLEFSLFDPRKVCFHESLYLPSWPFKHHKNKIKYALTVLVMLVDQIHW